MHRDHSCIEKFKSKVEAILEIYCGDKANDFIRLTNSEDK